MNPAQRGGAANAARIGGRPRPEPTAATRAEILCLDVDGAPFIHRDLLSLLDAGFTVHQAPCRPVPAEWLEGDLARLRVHVVRRSPFSPGTYLDALRGILRRPAVLNVAGRALVGLVAEPRMLVAFAAMLPWTISWIPWILRRRVTHVHANWAHLPATSAWVLSRSTGVPFSFSGHAGRDLFRTTALLREKLVDARFVVVCNEAAAEQIRSVAPNASTPLFVRTHGVDTRFWKPAESRRRGLLAVGTLAPAKGFDTLLCALPIVARERDDVELSIIGEGSEGPRLRRLAESLGVADRISWRGRLGAEELREAYRAAELLVMPSRVLQNGGRDGLPNVILEGMACGLPVVASRVGGIPEAVRDRESGRLVEPDNPSNLAQAILELMGDATMRASMAVRGRFEVEARYDLARARSDWTAVFEEMVGAAISEGTGSAPESHRIGRPGDVPRSSSSRD